MKWLIRITSTYRKLSNNLIIRIVRQVGKLTACGTGFALCAQEFFAKAHEVFEFGRLPLVQAAIVVGANIAFVLHSLRETSEFYADIKEVIEFCKKEELSELIAQCALLAGIIAAQLAILHQLFD